MSNPTPPRPGKFSPEVITAVAERLLPSVQEHLDNDSNGKELDDLKSALGDCSYDPHWEGYKLAKCLDEHYYWSEACDTRLCEILDNAEAIAYKVRQVLVSEWVKTNKIEPPYPVGTAVEFTSGWNKLTGKVAAINYGTAEYAVQEDGRTYSLSEPGFVAGYLVPYEGVKAIVEEAAHGSANADGSGSRSWSWSWSGSRSRSRPETVEIQLWDYVCRGDMAALSILMDRLQEEDFMLLEAGKIWIIRSATWTYVGLVTESTAMGVTLAPGAWRVPYLTDEGTWLEHGKFLSGDEAYPTPGTTFIPSLWIGPSEIPCEAFLREMPKWKRTHQPQN